MRRGVVGGSCCKTAVSPPNHGPFSHGEFLRFFNHGFHCHRSIPIRAWAGWVLDAGSRLCRRGLRRHRHQPSLCPEGVSRPTHHQGHTALTQEMVFGVVSLILWALIIIVTIKYVVLVMSADNNGEVAPSPSLPWRNAPWAHSRRDSARDGRSGPVLWRRHHHSCHLGPLGCRGPEARHTCL